MVTNGIWVMSDYMIWDLKIYNMEKDNNIKYLFVIIIILFSIVAYIRLEQVHPLYNIPVSNANQLSNKEFVFIKAYTGSKDKFYEEITKVALATPRTLLLSDAPLQFVTRSKFLAFPDITAIDIRDGTLIIYATSVFGKLDFGVNRKRVLKWINLLKKSMPMDVSYDLYWDYL